MPSDYTIALIFPNLDGGWEAVNGALNSALLTKSSIMETNNKPVSLERFEALLEPKPGTALKVMIEEHQFLDEFMAMMKKR